MERLPVTGVSELVLEVVDLERAEAFYAGVLGLPVVERWPDREAIWVMAGDRTRIGLWRPQVGLMGGRGGIHVHFAMHIAERDYDAAVAALRDRGAAVEEVRFGETHGRAAYVDDPDGNVVELWTWDVAGHNEQLNRREDQPVREEEKRQDEDEETSEGSADTPPALPDDDDDSDLGDTDQHSDAPA